MMEKNFKVNVTYTEYEDDELEKALEAYKEASNCLSAATEKYVPMIHDISKVKAEAILEQCKPLIKMIDKFSVISNNDNYYVSYIYDYGEGFNTERLYINVYPSLVMSDIKQCVKVCTSSSPCCNKHSIFEEDVFCVEKLLTIWNSEHIYDNLKKEFVRDLELRSKQFIKSANKLSNHVSTLLND